MAVVPKESERCLQETRIDTLMMRMHYALFWECRPQSFNNNNDKTKSWTMKTSSKAACLLSSRKTSCPSNKTSCKYLWYNVGSNKFKLQKTRLSLPLEEKLIISQARSMWPAKYKTSTALTSRGGLAPGSDFSDAGG